MAETLSILGPEEEEELLRQWQMTDAANQYLKDNPNVPPVDALVVTDDYQLAPVQGAKEAPAVTGAPAATPEDFSTIAPAVLGNPVNGNTDINLPPSKEVLDYIQMASDPKTPVEFVTAEDAVQAGKIFNSPRYTDPDLNDDGELAIIALKKEEEEGLLKIPTNPVISDTANPQVIDKVVEDLKQIRQETLDGFWGDPVREREDTQAVQDAEAEFYANPTMAITGAVPTPSKISRTERAELNAAVDSNEFYSMPWKQWADDLDRVFAREAEAENYSELTNLQNYYNEMRDLRKVFRDAWELWMAGDESQLNPFNREDFTGFLSEEQAILIPEVLEAMSNATGGIYDDQGRMRNPYQIVRDFKKIQRFRSGLGQTLLDLVRTPFMDDEDIIKERNEKRIFDMLAPDPVSGEVLSDYAGAVLGDPFTYTSLGLSAAANFAVQKTVKAVTKEVSENLLKDLTKRAIRHKATTGAVSSALVGASWASAFDVIDQNLRINLGLQDEMDWRRFAEANEMALLITGPLGALVGGLSSRFNNAANRYMQQEGAKGNPTVPRDVYLMLKNSIDNERDFYTFMRRLGYDRKEVLAELKTLRDKGFTYNKENKVWKTKEGETYVPPDKMKFRDEAYDSSRNYDTLTKDAAGGDDYVHITASQATTPRGRTAVGQRIFDTIDQKVGRWATDLVYGGDSKLIHLNMREELDNFRAARDEAEINATRVNNKLKDLRAANPEELADESIYRLIRDPKLSRTPAQEAYIKEFLKEKNHMLTRAYKSGVLSKEQYQNFIKDVTYIPRVWNLQYLTTDEGASMLSQFLREVWSIDKKAARSVVRNLTGENYVDELTASQFAPTKLKNAIVFRADEDLSVLNSTHLDFNRKIKIPREIEPALDMFMAKLDDRMLSFFDDTFTRTAMASRFGAKHERVAARANALRRAGNSRAAKAWEDYFYTNTNDLRSPVIQTARDNAKFADIVRRVNAYQTVSKLGAAQILNATQVFVNGATVLSKQGGTALLTAPFRAIRSISRALFKNKKDFQLAKEAASIAEMDMQRVVTENAIHGRIVDKQFNSKILSFLNEPTKFLRGVGYMKVEEANRVAATALGNWQLRKWHSDLQRLVSTGKGQSSQALKLYKDLKGFGVKNPLAEEIPVRDLQYATYKFNREINFAGETINLPQHWKTPLGKLLSKFKSFSFYQARFLKRHVLDEAFLHGNINPLIMYLSAAGIAGGGVGAIRDTISLKDVKQDREALEALVYGISRAGGFGLFVDTLRDVGERGSGLVDTIAGPTLGDIERGYVSLTSGQIDKIFDMLSPAPIPNISNIKF